MFAHGSIGGALTVWEMVDAVYSVVEAAGPPTAMSWVLTPDSRVSKAACSSCSEASTSPSQRNIMTPARIRAVGLPTFLPA